MSSIRSYVVPTPEQIAREFHEAYEAFAPEFGYSTRRESAVQWDEVPEANRALMIATVRNVLIEQHNLLRIAETAADERAHWEAVRDEALDVNKRNMAFVHRLVHLVVVHGSDPYITLGNWASDPNCCTRSKGDKPQ